LLLGRLHWQGWSSQQVAQQKDQVLDGSCDWSNISQASLPQAAYSGLQKSLQQEWHFVQRVTKGIGPKFASIEQTLAKTFLPTLFGNGYDNDDPWSALAGLPVKWAGLVIPDPTTLVQPNYEASILLCSHILAAFQGVHVFWSTNHLKVIKEVKADLKLHNATKSKASLNNQESPAVKRLIQNSHTENRGDILIQGLWARGTACIMLEAHKRERKKKYL
jgi:hypothetical protein